MTRIRLFTFLLFAFTLLAPVAHARAGSSLVTIRNDNNETIYFGTRPSENELLFLNRNTPSTSLALNPGESIHLSVQTGRHFVRWLEESRTGRIEVGPHIRASITIVRDDRGRLTAILRQDDRIVRRHTFPDTVHVHRPEPVPVRHEGTLLLRNATGIGFDVVVNEAGRTVHVYQQHGRRTRRLESRLIEIPLQTGGYRLYLDGERMAVLFTIFNNQITEFSFHQMHGSRTQVNVEGRRENFRFHSRAWTLPHPVRHHRSGRGGRGGHSRDHGHHGHIGRTPTTLQTPPVGGSPVHLIAPVAGHPAIILYPPDHRHPNGRTEMRAGRGRNDHGTLLIYGPMLGRSAMVVQPLMGRHPGFRVEPPRSGHHHGGRHGTTIFQLNSSSGERSTEMNIAPLINLIGALSRN